MNIFLSNSDDGEGLIFVNLIQNDGKEIKFDLKKINDFVYSTGPVDIPSDSLKISVNRVDQSLDEGNISIILLFSREFNTHIF